MLNDKWSKYRAEQKDYEDAYNKLQELIKASNSLTPAPLTHRNNDFISLGKDTNVEIIRYQSNDLVTTNPESIKLATQILKEVKQNTSLTYKELTDVLNTACSLTIPSESQKTSEHAEATLAYLHRLNTADSKRFYGLLMALAGVALIAASIALTVFTFGGALPLVLAIIPIAHPLIAVGVVAVTGAALGAVDIKTGIENRQEAKLDLKTQFSQALLFGYLNHNEEAKNKMKVDLSRVFGFIYFTPDLNKKIYESLTQAAEKGELKTHLQDVAKDMSDAFLDENHNLKPHIKTSLNLNHASEKDQNEIINKLLQSTVTLYLETATAYCGKIIFKKTNEQKDNFNHLISNPANFYNNQDISKQSLFETSKPDDELLITNIADFDNEIRRLMDFVHDYQKDIKKDKINKIIEILDSKKSTMADKTNPLEVHNDRSKTTLLIVPEPQKRDLESIILKEMSNQMQQAYDSLIDKGYTQDDIERFKKTKPDYDAEHIKGPGSP